MVNSGINMQMEKGKIPMVNTLKITRVVGLSVLAVLFISACSTLKVSENYDTNYDFSKLKTFNFIPSEDKKNELTIRQVEKELKSQLVVKGFRFVDANPDFRIAVYGGSEDKVSVRNTYSGYHYGGWYTGGFGGGGFAGSRVDVYEYKEGTLVLDFYDSKRKEMIFQSIATKELLRNPGMEARLKSIKNTITNVIKSFPPASKNK